MLYFAACIFFAAYSYAIVMGFVVRSLYLLDNRIRSPLGRPSRAGFLPTTGSNPSLRRERSLGPRRILRILALCILFYPLISPDPVCVLILLQIALLLASAILLSFVSVLVCLSFAWALDALRSRLGAEPTDRTPGNSPN